MKISENGIKFVKQFEGLKLRPYMDVRGRATIGFGSTYYLDGTPVSITDQSIGFDMALKLLENHLNDLGKELEGLVEVPLKQNQTDALLDFVYNVGIGHFETSTLLKLLNNSDYEGAGNQFICWEYAGGHINQGIIKRRLAEKQLFMS